MPFAHLHAHSDYSFLDGVGKSVEYAELAARAGQTHLALTDHGNMHGHPAHKKACEKFGIVPCFGIECYANDERANTAEIRTRARDEKLDKARLDPTFTDSHLVVLARTQAGYSNLLKINHDAVRNGYYFKPRTTHEFVCRHADGLVATTTCIGSIFNQLALRGDDRRLAKILRQFKDAFGEHFYREVHVNEMPEQKRADEFLKRHCDALGILPVLACDVHYACSQDVDRQDEMIAAQRRMLVSDPKSFKLTTRELWFTDVKAAWAAVKKWGYPFSKAEFADMIVRAGEVAESCKADIYPDAKLKPPAYLDDGGDRVDPSAFLRKLAVDGFRKYEHLFPDRIRYAAQLKHELAVVRRLGLEDFYLVTWDVTRFCRSRGILVWPRGSGCASLLAALIGITTIDPMRFGLLFERFMDPDRPSPPDFDLDINASRRHEAIEFLYRKYGGPDGERIARVCSITTYGMKSAIRDVLAARGIDLSDAIKLSEVVERMEPAVGWPIPKAEQVLASAGVADRAAAVDAALAELRDKASPPMRDFIDVNIRTVRGAMEMVGRVRGRGLHAAGFVVGPDALSNYMPIDRAVGDNKEKIITTAWTEGQHAQDISPTGLLKIDMLGLETVAVVEDAKRIIGREAADKMDPWTTDYADPLTLAEFRVGDGTGIHQLNESNGAMARFVRDLRPRSVDDVVAAIAVYRPGAIEHMGDFVERARGKQRVPKVHPTYDAIVEETYGVLVYQEQVMRAMNELAGIQRRRAYEAVKAISKKKESEVLRFKDEFAAGCSESGVPDAVMNEVWENVTAFAGYAFAKSHSASYAALAWQTAYLRAHHPAEFWLCWLRRVPNVTKGKGSSKVRKVEAYMRRARARGIDLVAPVIGASRSNWVKLPTGRLLAPLSLVIGIGDAAADAVADAYRKQRWPDVWAFLAWAESHGRIVNSRALAALAKAGAFRRWCSTAAAVDSVAVFAESKATKANGTRAAQARAAIEGQAKHYRVTLDDDETEATFERQAFGFSFWKDPWEMSGRRAFARSLAASGRIAEDSPRGDRALGKRRAACVRHLRRHRDRRGGLMAFLDLETVEGRAVKGVVFASAFATCRHLAVDRVYLFRGDVEPDGSLLVSGRDCAVPLDDVMVRERV